MVLEELESRGLGRHSVDDMGYLLWLLLVEGYRHEFHDVLEVVEGYGEEGLWEVRIGAWLEVSKHFISQRLA